MNGRLQLVSLTMTFSFRLEATNGTEVQYLRRFFAAEFVQAHLIDSPKLSETLAERRGRTQPCLRVDLCATNNH